MTDINKALDLLRTDARVLGPGPQGDTARALVAHIDGLTETVAWLMDDIRDTLDHLGWDFGDGDEWVQEDLPACALKVLGIMNEQISTMMDREAFAKRQLAESIQMSTAFLERGEERRLLADLARVKADLDESVEAGKIKSARAEQAEAERDTLREDNEAQKGWLVEALRHVRGWLEKSDHTHKCSLVSDIYGDDSFCVRCSQIELIDRALGNGNDNDKDNQTT